MNYDSEVFVEKCYYQHRLNFSHSYKHTYLDRIGVDFKVFNEMSNEVFDLQVKTSDTGMTIGMVLPILKPLPEGLTVISKGMLEKAALHFRRHQNVPYIIFVARVGARKTEEMVIDEIWRETERMFFQSRLAA